MHANRRSTNLKKSVTLQAPVGCTVSYAKGVWTLTDVHTNSTEIAWQIPQDLLMELLRVRIGDRSSKPPKFEVPDEMIDWIKQYIVPQVNGEFDFGMLMPLRLAMAHAVQKPLQTIVTRLWVNLPELKVIATMILRHGEPSVNWKFRLQHMLKHERTRFTKFQKQQRVREHDRIISYSNLKFDEAIDVAIHGISAIDLRMPNDVVDQISQWLLDIGRFDDVTLREFIRATKVLVQELYKKMDVAWERSERRRPKRIPEWSQAFPLTTTKGIRVILSKKAVLMLLGFGTKVKVTIPLEEFIGNEHALIEAFLSPHIKSYRRKLPHIVTTVQEASLS